MKILMLCPMLSSSSFITAYPFAKILSKHHDVTIAGPLFGKKSTYIKDDNLKFEYIEPLVNSPVQLGMMSLVYKNLFRLLKKDYDIVHVFKTLPHTSPVASFAKRFTKKPFVLTIDDYDAVGGGGNPIKKMFLKMSEGSYKSADAVFVSSTMLQSIYGGNIFYQVPNEEIFKKFDKKTSVVKKNYDLDGKIVIMYAGTLYEHKGVDVLIKAVKALNRDDVKLLIIGSTLGGKEVEEYKKLAGDETIFVGQIPIERMPEFVDACDIYAIPTKDTVYTRAEIPAKIFEPMIMGKTVVASNISDIPKILDDGKCGVLVKPGDVESMKNALEELIEDPSVRFELGKNARERYNEKYSYAEKEKNVMKVYEGLI